MRGRFTRGTAANAAATAALLLACGDGRTGPGETPPPASHEVRIAIVGDGRGAVRVTPSGMTCATGGGTCAAAFSAGAVLTLAATPEAGSTFGGWTGAPCGNAPSCAITVGGAQTVTAAFARPPEPAPAPPAPPPAPAPAPTPAPTPTPTPAPTPPPTPPAPPPPSPPPPATFALTLATAGAGIGNVTSTPAGIVCTRTGGAQTGACGASFADGASVALTATPAAGSAFAGWGGACAGPGACVVSMTAARSVTATFAPAPPATVTLGVTLAGAGGGTVLATPAAAGGISCTRTQGAAAQTGTCSQEMTPGTTVTLAAAPAPGSTFLGWSRGCAGTGTCVVTPQSALTVTATFGLVPPPVTHVLAVTTAGAGAGSVASAPAGVGCTRASGGQSGACAASFPAGTGVTLTATPAAGSTFAGWGGACAGAGTCVVTMGAAQAVTAAFALPQVTLAVSVVGSGAGGVTSNPSGINCVRAGGAQSGACSAGFAIGTVVTLTATPAVPAGSLISWGGACGPLLATTCTVTMDAARGVTAVIQSDVSAPTIAITGVVTGGTYSSHPGIGLSFADDIGFGASPLRVTLRATTAVGAVLCATSAVGNALQLGPGAGAACPTLAMPSYSVLTVASAPPGSYGFSVRAVDAAGNASAPAGVGYTIIP